MENIINSAAAIRQNNKKIILGYLLAHDCVSKKEIALKTNLSVATVSNLSNQLIEDGFLSVDSFQKSSGGRNAGLLTVANNQKYYLALRIVDGTRIDAEYLRFEREIVKSFSVHVEEISREGILNACVKGVNLCRESVEKEKGDILGIGVALPGIVDQERGVLLHSTIRCLEGEPVIGMLQELFPEYPVTGANESNILALALAKIRSKGLNLQDTIYIHVDEGLGIGVICNGSLLTGSHNRGGEINHMPLGEKGRVCGCGQRGCIETELSISGFLTDYEESAHHTLTWDRFCAAAKRDEPEVVKILEVKGRLMGKLLSLLDAMFDPYMFYFGGQGVELFEELYPYIMLEYQERQVIDKSKKVMLTPCYEYDKLLIQGCSDLLFAQNLIV